MADEPIPLSHLLLRFIKTFDGILEANHERFSAYDQLRKAISEEHRDDYWEVTGEIEAAARQLSDQAIAIRTLMSELSADMIELGWRDDVQELISQCLSALMDFLFLLPWPSRQHDYQKATSAAKFEKLLDRISGARLQLVTRLMELIAWEDAKSVADNPPSKTPRRSRADRRMEAHLKIVSALREHHGYETDSYNHTPISNADLAEKTQLSSSMVSRWFKSRFREDGRDAYCRICASNGVHKWLEALSGEMTFGTLADLDAVTGDDD